GCRASFMMPVSGSTVVITHREQCFDEVEADGPRLKATPVVFLKGPAANEQRCSDRKRRMVRFGTTKPSPSRLALRPFNGSVSQRINQTRH
ncbi:hypothetical protein, partial [Tamilnaduibacter salinus]|uniref:hypothetical protein n=1 Tax=Tamilnaduibacter salinus TaxID=1484056 RepID=UPI001B80BEDB